LEEPPSISLLSLFNVCCPPSYLSCWLCNVYYLLSIIVISSQPSALLPALFCLIYYIYLLFSRYAWALSVDTYSCHWHSRGLWQTGLTRCCSKATGSSRMTGVCLSAISRLVQNIFCLLSAILPYTVSLSCQLAVCYLLYRLLSAFLRDTTESLNWPVGTFYLLSAVCRQARYWSFNDVCCNSKSCRCATMP
jgi:hypothetical protein